MAVSREEIKEYYSNVSMKEHGEMATNTCACGPECMPAYIQKILDEIPEEVTSRFYGCGSPLPPALEGCTVLDLGCGTGRDVFLASKLVGPTGKVIGVDMNEDQLGIAEKHHAEMAAKWGYDNVEFKKGFIEALDEIGIADNSIDVVISNCVINLSPDKEQRQAILDEYYGPENKGHDYSAIKMKHADDVLRSLHESGYVIGLATSNSPDMIDRCLEQNDWRKYFSVVLGVKDVTRQKPDPMIYLKAMNILEVRPEETVIIEDSRTGLDAALASGAHVIARKETRLPIDQSGAQYYIDDLIEILNIVNELNEKKT